MAVGWHEPVRIQLGGVTHIIFDNVRAAEILLMEWPTSHDAHHRAAQETILRAMRRPDDPHLTEQSRVAFAVAAREAGILTGGRTVAIVKYGYHLVDMDGAETFTSNRALAERLGSQGWMMIGYLALPIAATDAMVRAAEGELASILPAGKPELPEGGMRRVLTAALSQINGG